MIISCDWSVKDNDNESNSQLELLRDRYKTSCDWSVKDNDNESNSQLVCGADIPDSRCDWSVKDNDNESNSQPARHSCGLLRVVIGLSKIMIMKAIHNVLILLHLLDKVVIGLSKIMIMKAIHNYL